MRVFQMAGEEKMDDWDELDPDAYWGWVGVGPRNRRTAGSANFHTLQDRPTSLFICPLDHMQRPRIRLTQDDVVVSASASLERSVSSTV